MNRVISQAPLTPEEAFAACDFTKKDQIVGLFPDYMQEQIKLRSNTKKPISKAVNIEGFTLKTPFGDRTLLKQTNLILEAGKRQCLFGPNASGKTLLFTHMAEKKIRDFPRHIHVHHCRELETHELHDSVLDTVVKCYPYRNILVKVEAHLIKLLAADPAPTGDVKAALQENLDFIQFSINSIKGTDADARLKASKMLRVLGFDEIGQAKLCSALSGGLRMRVALCMAFFIEADLLLLDEPTNHLDFPSVLWLENRLRGYKGSFLLVSHDRELLNKVCTSVLLLEDCQIKYYPMGFAEFEKKKAAEDKKKYEDTEKFLKKNPNADPSTMLGKQRHDAKEWADNYHRKQIALAAKFTFPSSTPLDNDEKDADGNLVAPENISVINMKNLRFSYDEKTGHWIFNDPISFNCTASTRVGVMGPNGAGKSTFLKLLTGKLKPNSGDVITHPNFTLAYFGQHSTAELDLEKTATEFMEQSFPKVSSGLLKQHLAKTGVVGTVADTRMHRLSFSQRSCIVFAKLTYVCPHLLIMDEPTNFLDLESVDSLITACNKYKGALLLVSHNRDFLKKCARQYLSIVPGQFNIYNDLKTAERSTYTFIEEMEEGGKVGASALANNPGGGTVHSSQKTGAAAAADDEKKAAGPAAATTLPGGAKVITLTSASVSSKPVAVAKKPAVPDHAAAIPKPVVDIKAAVALPKVAAPADNSPVEVVYLDGEKVQAKWKDGKFYNAVVKKFNMKDGKYTVLYTDYGNTSAVPSSSLRKLDASAPAKKTPPSAMAS